jgi:hypothetical protein
MTRTTPETFGWSSRRPHMAGQVTSAMLLRRLMFLHGAESAAAIGTGTFRRAENNRSGDHGDPDDQHGRGSAPNHP